MFIQIFFTFLCVIATIVLFTIVKKEFSSPLLDTQIGGITIAAIAVIPFALCILWIWAPEWCNANLFQTTNIICVVSLIAWLAFAIRHFSPHF